MLSGYLWFKLKSPLQGCCKVRSCMYKWFFLVNPWLCPSILMLNRMGQSYACSD